MKIKWNNIQLRFTSNWTYPRNGTTSWTSSAREMISSLKMIRHRRKLSYASALRKAFRTYECTHNAVKTFEIKTTCILHQRPYVNPKQLTLSKKRDSVPPPCLPASVMDESLIFINLSFFWKKEKNSDIKKVIPQKKKKHMLKTTKFSV